jgi:hypothetical protein
MQFPDWTPDTIISPMRETSLSTGFRVWEAGETPQGLLCVFLGRMS